ncbi:putative leader peptide [Nakamurella flava]
MTTTNDQPAQRRVVSVLSVQRRHVDLQRVSSALCCR